jgi:hypothetical protein
MGMAKKSIEKINSRKLDLTNSFEMVDLIMKNPLTPADASTLGLGKPYHELRATYNRLVEIFKRNPAVLQTEELVVAIEKLRRKMSVFNTRLREMLADDDGTKLHAAKVVNNVAHPYLKDSGKTQQTALVANAKEMVDALQNTTNLPLITSIDLTVAVTEIKTLAHEADQLILLRGEEKAFQKDLGTASEVRKLLEKQLRFVFYSAIPVHYAEATGELATKFENTIIAINGILDTFRHLISSGGSGSGGDGSGDDGIIIVEPDDPENPGGDETPGGDGNEPDPETPPSGGGDEGSGGPLDRGGITININE